MLLFAISVYTNTAHGSQTLLKYHLSLFTGLRLMDKPCTRSQKLLLILMGCTQPHILNFNCTEIILPTLTYGTECMLFCRTCGNHGIVGEHFETEDKLLN